MRDKGDEVWSLAKALRANYVFIGCYDGVDEANVEQILIQMSAFIPDPCVTCKSKWNLLLCMRVSLCVFNLHKISFDDDATVDEDEFKYCNVSVCVCTTNHFCSLNILLY